jgi:hypothetical protein
VLVYDELREAVQQMQAGNPAGNPAASAAALPRIVDAEEPPLRCFFGTGPIHVAEAGYASRLATWRAWQPVAELAQG